MPNKKQLKRGLITVEGMVRHTVRTQAGSCMVTEAHLFLHGAGGRGGNACQLSWLSPLPPLTESGYHPHSRQLSPPQLIFSENVHTERYISLMF